MANVSKSDVGNWETVETYVATFPSDDGEGACDVEVQIGSATRYEVLVNGLAQGWHNDRDEAQAEADELNEEAEEELGYGGAASVGETEVWFIRTCDDAGGSDDAGDTEYETRSEAEIAAATFAGEQDQNTGEGNAEDYLRRATEEAAGAPDPEGHYCVYWETSLEDSGPQVRYATLEQATAAAKLANDGLHKHNPGGNLLCGFAVRELVDGAWVKVSS